MIERLLAAESALAEGNLDAAERLYGQIAAGDPKNAIAIVGLARVAHRRGDAGTARDLAERALAIDPEEAAATRLLAEQPAPTAAPPSGPPSRPSLLARLRAWLRARVGRP